MECRAEIAERFDLGVFRRNCFHQLYQTRMPALGMALHQLSDLAAILGAAKSLQLPYDVIEKSLAAGRISVL